MSVNDDKKKAAHRQALWFNELLGRCLMETHDAHEAALAASLAFDLQPEPPTDFKFKPVSVSAPPPPPVSEQDRQQMRMMLSVFEGMHANLLREQETNPILRDTIGQAKEMQAAVAKAAKAEADAAERQAALSINAGHSPVKTLMLKALDILAEMFRHPLQFQITLPPRQPRSLTIRHSDGSTSKVEEAGADKTTPC